MLTSLRYPPHQVAASGRLSVSSRGTSARPS